MDYIWTLDGLLYNGPAVLVLAWLLVRRPVAGLLLAGLIYERVVLQTGFFSGHAAVGMAALLALPGWERVAGACLVGFTAWYYFGLWNEPTTFYCGLALGGIIGLFALLVQQLWRYVREDLPS